MTLPCSASRDIFADNRIGKYTTVLAREVVLDAEYEVGLSECVIPVPRRSLNFKEPMILRERGLVPNGVEVQDSQYEIDAAEITTLTDFQDKDLNIPKARDDKNEIFKFSVRGKSIVMTVGPCCTVTFNERNKQLARLLGFAPGDYVGFEMKSKEHQATRPFGGSGNLFFCFYLL